VTGTKDQPELSPAAPHLPAAFEFAQPQHNLFYTQPQTLLKATPNSLLEQAFRTVGHAILPDYSLAGSESRLQNTSFGPSNTA